MVATVWTIWPAGKGQIGLPSWGQMELHLDLDSAPGRTLRARAEHALREAVRSGRLAPGSRLPATRALAVQLGVSRGVVVEAYAQLAAEGYLDTRRGGGTRVAEHPAPPPIRPTSGVEGRLNHGPRRFSRPSTSWTLGLGLGAASGLGGPSRRRPCATTCGRRSRRSTGSRGRRGWPPSRASCARSPTPPGLRRPPGRA